MNSSFNNTNIIILSVKHYVKNYMGCSNYTSLRIINKILYERI